ncbi:MAG TPA: hypothetical protein VHR66_17570 [Gemmataceae bacterium]|jgi:hypothetical protein|nr:hypothetical protein [Gemmataceae bacterium]
MSIDTFRGIVRGSNIVLLEKGPSLREGTEVLITPIHPPGSAAAIIAAIESPPHVPSEWVDELELLIAGGARPPAQAPSFDDHHANAES